MDFIYIHDLKIATIIGAYDWEKTIKQTIFLDIEIGVDVVKIAKDDDLAITINYAAIAERLTGYLSLHRCQLLETLAEHIWQLLQQEFGVTHLRLKIRKPGIIPTAKEVGIVIERGQPGI